MSTAKRNRGVADYGVWDRQPLEYIKRVATKHQWDDGLPDLQILPALPEGADYESTQQAILDQLQTAAGDQLWLMEEAMEQELDKLAEVSEEEEEEEEEDHEEEEEAPGGTLHRG